MAQNLSPPFSLIALDRVDSTNDRIRAEAEKGAGHGTVVWALEQTAGRGRRGRTWLSPLGNLHFSLLLEPRPGPSEAPQLAFVGAVALRQALAELAPAAAFQVKWPNDVLHGGRKLAGMLLEKVGGLVILGVGVDIVHAPENMMVSASCLRRAGSDAEPFDVLASFCSHLQPWYDLWRSQGFAPIRQAWLDHATGIGGPVTVRLADDAERVGRFAGLDQDGALLLEESDGRQTPVFAGDVFFR